MSYSWSLCALGISFNYLDNVDLNTFSCHINMNSHKAYSLKTDMPSSNQIIEGNEKWHLQGDILM